MESAEWMRTSKCTEYTSKFPTLLLGCLMMAPGSMRLPLRGSYSKLGEFYFRMYTYLKPGSTFFLPINNLVFMIDAKVRSNVEFGE